MSHCLMYLVNPGRKLAAGTALLLRQKCLEFRSEKTFHIKYLRMRMYSSLTILALLCRFPVTAHRKMPLKSSCYTIKIHLHALLHDVRNLT